jgi:hypothetical protein
MHQSFHKVMVGVRIDGAGEPDFFGWDELNELIWQGMKVVAVLPGDFYQGDLDNIGVHTMVWYSMALLADHGVDQPEPDAAVDSGSEGSSPASGSPREIPW